MTTKEDKKIISTLALINDNKNKLTLLETLNKSIKKIEADPKGEWIRSGKVTGRPIQDRLNEHKIGAKLKCKSDRDNKFYRSYPLNTLGLRGSTNG